MRSLQALDLAQLRQVQAAIAAFKTQSASAQMRKRHLLEALTSEEATLRQYCRRAGGRIAATAAQAA